MQNEKTMIETGTVLGLTVANHPGVMSHVCGLFARRAYNVEAILCLPMSDVGRSRIWLWVNEDQRLDQIEQQVRKLQDVFQVDRYQIGDSVFQRMQALLTMDMSAG